MAITWQHTLWTLFRLSAEEAAAVGIRRPEPEPKRPNPWRLALQAAAEQALPDLVAGSDEILVLEVSRRLAAKEQSWGFGALGPVEERLFLLGELDRDVNNGGFEAFFFNSAGGLAERVLTAARQADLGTVVDQLEACLKVFGGEIPADHLARRRRVVALPEAARARLKAQSEAFYSTAGARIEALACYLRRHAHTLELPPLDFNHGMSPRQTPPRYPPSG